MQKSCCVYIASACLRLSSTYTEMWRTENNYNDDAVKPLVFAWKNFKNDIHCKFNCWSVIQSEVARLHYTIEPFYYINRIIAVNEDWPPFYTYVIVKNSGNIFIKIERLNSFQCSTSYSNKNYQAFLSRLFLKLKVMFCTRCPSK